MQGGWDLPNEDFLGTCAFGPACRIHYYLMLAPWILISWGPEGDDVSNLKTLGEHQI